LTSVLAHHARDERGLEGRWPHVLARRVHRKVGRGGRAALCARAPRTQDLLVPGLGGWCAGDPLLFRLQRVMTRAVEVTPAARLSFVWKEFLS
jgi:hypothetical protein